MTKSSVRPRTLPFATAGRSVRRRFLPKTSSRPSQKLNLTVARELWCVFISTTRNSHMKMRRMRAWRRDPVVADPRLQLCRHGGDACCDHRKRHTDCLFVPAPAKDGDLISLPPQVLKRSSTRLEAKRLTPNSIRLPAVSQLTASVSSIGVAGDIFKSWVSSAVARLDRTRVERRV